MNPVRLIKLLYRLNKIFKEIEGMKGIRFSVNFVIQVCGIIGHAAAQLMDFLPDNKKIWASVAIAAAQGVSGIMAHFSNPDGSPASEPYHPPR